MSESDRRSTRRTKIICTLGPASRSPGVIRSLVDAGMDVARLNFSHGTHDEHAALYDRVREASDASGRAVGVLADLQGPKIRAEAASAVGRIVDAQALAVFTQTGRTAQRLASHRSPIPVLAFTSDAAVRSRLALTWGVETFIAPLTDDPRQAIVQVEQTMLRLGRGRPGERVVIVAGHPGQPGSTHTVRVHQLAAPGRGTEAA